MLDEGISSESVLRLVRRIKIETVDSIVQFVRIQIDL